MKKQIFFIGAVIIIVISGTFAYTSHSDVAQQITSTQATAHATFKVGEKTYAVGVAPNETVMSAMRALASTTDFIYASRNYPGLGEFVDSINGKKNAGGMYWILYVNGVSAASGVSATTLHAGDVVEWKYEKGY